MKIHGDIQINGTWYAKGSDVPWYKIYPVFLFHMGAFGTFAFIAAYSLNFSAPALFFFGGITILIYMIFYISIFGLDEIKWMLLNAAIGITAFSWLLDRLLMLFGKRYNDYPLSVHIIPMTYIVIYTFLIRQAILDITDSRHDINKKQRTEDACATIFTMIIFYLLLDWFYLI
jgi:hypothetical protein